MKNPKSFWCAEDLFAGPFLSLGDSNLSPKDTSRCLPTTWFPIACQSSNYVQKFCFRETIKQKNSAFFQEIILKS